MTLKNVPLFFSICLSFQFIACAQNADKLQTNQNKSTIETASDQSKEIEIPSGIEERDYVKNPDKSILFLTLNSDGKVFYQDKTLDEAALKTVLAEYNEKHKNDPTTTGKKSWEIVKDAKYFYLKADSRLPFLQVLKVLKEIQASSATSYRAKFVVKPQKEVPAVPEDLKDKAENYRTSEGIYVSSLDLGVPEKIDEKADPPRPNPLTLHITLAADGKVKINNELKERKEFSEFLQDVFKEREKYGVFIEGTMEIEKTVFVFFAPDTKYGDVIQFIDELKVIGAIPIKMGNLLGQTERGGIGSGRRSKFGT